MAHELRPLADPEQAVLKALSTRKRQLTESIAVEKTRLKQAFDPLVVESCREMIAFLEEKRLLIERDLDRRIEAEDRMARRRAILSSIPGIGARISSLLVVEMPELGALDRKAVASLAGLAPHPSQSGLSPGRNAIQLKVQDDLSRSAKRRKARKGRPHRHPPTHGRPGKRPHPRRHNLPKRHPRLTQPIQSPEIVRRRPSCLDRHALAFARARDDDGRLVDPPG